MSAVLLWLPFSYGVQGLSSQPPRVPSRSWIERGHFTEDCILESVGKTMGGKRGKLGCRQSCLCSSVSSVPSLSCRTFRDDPSGNAPVSTTSVGRSSTRHGGTQWLEDTVLGRNGGSHRSVGGGQQACSGKEQHAFDHGSGQLRCDSPDRQSLRLRRRALRADRVVEKVKTTWRKRLRLAWLDFGYPSEVCSLTTVDLNKCVYHEVLLCITTTSGC